MSSSPWEAAIEAMEGDLDRLAALATDPTVAAEEEAARAVAFAPPGDLGPMPVELLQRVLALLERMDTTRDAVSAALSAVGQELQATARLSAPQGAGDPSPRFIDTSA